MLVLVRLQLHTRFELGSPDFASHLGPVACKQTVLGGARAARGPAAQQGALPHHPRELVCRLPDTSPKAAGIQTYH